MHVQVAPAHGIRMSVLVAALVFPGGCCSRVIMRQPVPGHPSAEVKFVRTDYLLNGRPFFGHPFYEVELPNGAVTKDWLHGGRTTDDQIRRECHVEYDGQTLKVVGPGTEAFCVPGYTIKDDQIERN